MKKQNGITLIALLIIIIIIILSIFVLKCFNFNNIKKQTYSKEEIIELLKCGVECKNYTCSYEGVKSRKTKDYKEAIDIGNGNIMYNDYSLLESYIVNTDKKIAIKSKLKERMSYEVHPI